MDNGILGLFALGMLLWFWVNARTAHEKVLQLSAKVCRDLGVQRLDDTVALRRIGCRWTGNGPTITRSFRFEFSNDGTDRAVGEIRLVGLQLDWIRVDQPGGGTVFIE